MVVGTAGIDARREAVEQVVASRTLSRAPRLCSLLQHICYRSIEGRDDELTEQQIGVQVFHRAPGYSSGDDNIVRSAARQLRQKLEQYYETEAEEAAIRIEIPKGGYVPVFRTPDVAGEAEAEPASPAARRRFGLGVVIAVAVLSVGLVAFAAWMFIWSQHRGPNHDFWTRVFSPERQTVVVVGDAGLNIFDNLARRQVMAAEYMSGAYLSQPQAKTPDGYDWAPLAHRRYTTLSDLELMESLHRLPEFLAGRTVVRFARDIRVEDLKSRNVILAGSPITNPWSELIAARMNFQIEYGGQSNTIYVHNRKPRAGEKDVYTWSEQDPGHIGYAHIALTKNPGEGGNVLLVEGTTMAGLSCATDFLMSSARLEEALRRSGGAEGDHEFLLEAVMLDGSSPSGKLIAVR